MYSHGGVTTFNSKAGQLTGELYFQMYHDSTS